ncbi:MAG: trypsin-like peptidase domain-containing protein [Bacteroidales bacterium]|nr:trypsin-like peptidase domain-containing protein [Bacteroidales bacterium]MBK7628311.1 trypsin-like peptidase domain-containing protein [Bacteroidales bacterium]
MKGKYLLGGFVMALLGATIALFAYTRIIDKPTVVVTKDSSGVDVQNARAFLTSMQMQEGQIDFTYAAEQTVHAVVHVRTKTMVAGQADNPIMEWFYGDRYTRPREVQGFGSGVIISADGYIITNNHVIEDAESVDVKLNDNRTLTAEVIGRDPGSDIALLKVKADNLPYIKYGDSEQLRLGEWVLAVGNPFNLTSTVTAGIVSAKGRSLGLNSGNYRIESFIQTDAALNMGNSGGALVNTKGLLVGITSAIYSPNGAYAGNSFAIPVSIVKKIVDDLKEFGEVQRAIIGVNIRDVESEDAEKQNLNEVKGILVTGIIAGGSAEEANMKVNDVIIKFDNKQVNTTSELQEQVGKHRPGDKATVTYLRNGKEVTIPIVLKNAAGTTSVVTSDMTDNIIYGARLEPITSADKRNYRIESGVKVVELKDGKFKDFGMPKGYIITSVNGKKVNSADDVLQATNNEKTLRSIGGIQPDGGILNYQFGN